MTNLTLNKLPDRDPYEVDGGILVVVVNELWVVVGERLCVM